MIEVEQTATSKEFKVGQRVRLLTDIWDDGADHHPSGYIAHKGEEVIVRNTGRAFPFYVSHEHVKDNSFGVKLDEIEAVND
jgi:hypothetical protein